MCVVDILQPVQTRTTSKQMQVFIAFQINHNDIGNRTGQNALKELAYNSIEGNCT